MSEITTIARMRIKNLVEPKSNATTKMLTKKTKSQKLLNHGFGP
jgi:hypothetical protein